MATYWTRERLEDIRKILEELSQSTGRSGQSFIEHENSLPFTLWQEDVKNHPKVTLNQVIDAVRLLTFVGVVGEKSIRRGKISTRVFNPSKELTDENIEEYRIHTRKRAVERYQYNKRSRN